MGHELRLFIDFDVALQIDSKESMIARLRKQFASEGRLRRLWFWEVRVKRSRKGLGAGLALNCEVPKDVRHLGVFNIRTLCKLLLNYNKIIKILYKTIIYSLYNLIISLF